MYTFINDNKTYIYYLYALVFIYAFFNNNNIYICNLYALVFTYGHLRSSSSLTVNEVHVLATKRLATKCPCDEMAGNSVPATKCQATKCPHDEMPGNEVSTRQNGWRRSVHMMKWQVTKRRRRKGMYPYVGSKFGQSIFDIVIRVCLQQVALTGDIEKAFLMLSMNERDIESL